MKYTSSIAERTILVVNRLFVATMTSAWVTTLRHQHALAPPEHDHGVGEIDPLPQRPPSTDDQLLH